MTRLAFLFVCLLTMPALGAAQDAPPPAAEEWVPDEVTNLTVLPKTLTPAEVMRIMRAWSEALRVECVFCHVGKRGEALSTFDFAADDKTRKETARIMLRASMQMNEQFKAIEADEPPRVMCATCHKRSRHVDADLPPPE